MTFFHGPFIYSQSPYISPSLTLEIAPPRKLLSLRGIFIKRPVSDYLLRVRQYDDDDDVWLLNQSNAIATAEIMEESQVGTGSLCRTLSTDELNRAFTY